MPGFSNEEAQLAINMTGVTTNLLEVKDAILADIETLKGWIAEAEADGNSKTRIYTYMDLQDDPENKCAAYKARLSLCLEMEKCLKSLGVKKAAKKKASSSKTK